MIEQLMMVDVKSSFPPVTNNGPGPGQLTKYDAVNDIGYFGRVSASVMPSVDLIESAAAAALGGVRSNTNVTWTKFYYKGKVIYYPVQSLRSGITWNSLYLAGFVYGTDNTGKFPDGNAATNQQRLFTFVDGSGTTWTFKVRLPQMINLDKYADGQNAGVPVSRESEFSTTFARALNFNNVPLVWDTITKPSVGCVGMETNSNFAAQSVYCTSAFVWGSFNRQAKGTTIANCQWYPVLELVPNP